MDTHEVEMLMDTATRWFASHAEQVAGPGTDRTDTVWQSYADLGWLALTLPDTAGGFGADTRTALRLARLNGRALATSPLELHLLLAPWLLRVGALNSPAWADALASGAMRLGLADASPQAAMSGQDDCRLTLAATEVYGGATATHVLVIGRDPDTGLARVALLPVDGPGVIHSPARWLDGRPCTRMSASNASATPLHDPEMPGLARELRQRASAALAADAAGAFEAAFDMTLVYLKQRVQFGKPLSTLQAVQHGMADIFCDLQQLLALVERLGLEDAGGDGVDAATLAATKSYLGRLIQLSGGIGVTDEYRLGRCYKRLHVAATLFGTSEDALRELDVRQALMPA